MSGLPDRPDLAQLRRQAKELHRSAVAGNGEGLRRLRIVSDRPTLSAAQLAVAREHGFDSWPRLRAAVEAARAPTGGPLMQDKYRRSTVYGPDDFLSWADAHGWCAGPVPVGAVFTSQTFITSYLSGQPDRYRPSGSLRPTNGRVLLTVAGPPVAIACLGVGASAIVTLLEHLVGLGVRSFIAIGPAPAVARDLRWGDCVVIDRALRDDGISSHYAPPARYASADASLTARLQAEAEAAGLRPGSGSAWTVPTPYRTTAEELSAYRGEGVLVTEMVTAALFAVAEALGARAASAVVATRAVDARAGGSDPELDRKHRGGQVISLLEAAVSVLQRSEVAS